MIAAGSRVLRWARVGVALAVVAAVGYAVVSQWDGVRHAAAEMAWLSIGLAFGCVVLGTLAGVEAWRTLLAEEGHPLPVLPAQAVFLLGQLGKYLPGSVWSVALQVELATRLGVPRARTFTATLAWVGLSLSSALCVGVLGMPWLGETVAQFRWLLLALVPIALLCSHPVVLTRLINLVLSLLRKDPLPHSLGWAGIGRAFGWLLVTWTLFGIQLWLLANSLGSPGWSGAIRSVSGFALAVGAGILFVVAPSGAGAREALIVGSLAGVMSEGEALGVAVVSRMLFTAADILLAVTAAIAAGRLLTSLPPVGPSARSDS